MYVYTERPHQQCRPTADIVVKKYKRVKAPRASSQQPAAATVAAIESPEENATPVAAPRDKTKNTEPEKIDYPPVPPLDNRSMATEWLQSTGDVSCNDTLEVQELSPASR